MIPIKGIFGGGTVGIIHRETSFRPEDRSSKIRRVPVRKFQYAAVDPNEKSSEDGRKMKTSGKEGDESNRKCDRIEG